MGEGCTFQIDDLSWKHKKGTRERLIELCLVCPIAVLAIVMGQYRIKNICIYEVLKVFCPDSLF